MAEDIRGGRAVDPMRETLSDPASTLKPTKPAGSEITLNDDGTADIDLGEGTPESDKAHFDNLADGMDPRDLSDIAMDLLDSIEVDKDARQKRDAQQEEGLRRTGLGNDAPGGAPFPGASRVVHPMMTEAVVDYSARVTGELLPPEGPVKSQTIGIPTNDKTDRADRTARHMNYQLTEEMPSFYSELEAGFTQQGIGGAFYTKMTPVDGRPDAIVVYIDKVHRPWSDGDFYSQQRITHEMDVDRQTFEANVDAGLWLDEIDPATSSDNVEQTLSSRSNDKIIGRDLPSENIDDVRVVYECSTFLKLDGDERPLPYLVTVDEQTRKVLSIYRNWKPNDPNKFRLDFLIEWPFWPWRGGYPVGFTHMIGGLSAAATGALRALMDAALLNSTQTGVKLKGGATSGGQKISPNVGSVTEMQGTLAMDDIRKTYMPLVFPQPSPTLFQLLGFLVDGGRGVIRTTFDEFNKMNGETPVGTANMMVEQGLKSFGAVFARQHRAIRRFLKQLWDYNQQTVENAQIVDQFGEVLVTKEDYSGPMVVRPVSDPRIFSDTQRQASAMMLSQSAIALPQVYKIREVELNKLRSMKVPEPEQFLIDAPMPQELNAAAENVAASQGLPLKAYPGQDHESHIAQHAAYMDSPLFGSNPILAMKFLPTMLNHFGDHLALWYADAMLVATNHVLQDTFKDSRITLDALEQVKGLEVQLDRLMAELTPEVMQHAQQELASVMPLIQKAQGLIKQMQPPTPMDPSVVAQQDVQRQTEADKAKAAADQQELQIKSKAVDAKAAEASQKINAQQQADNLKASTAAQKEQADSVRADQKAQADQDNAEKKHLVDAANIKVASDRNDVAAQTAEGQQQTELQTTDMDNKTAIEIEEMAIKAGKHKPAVSNGKGVGGKK